MPDGNELGRIRWLIAQSAKQAGINVSTNLVNRMADQMQQLLHSERLLLIWQETLDAALRGLEEDAK